MTDLLTIVTVLLAASLIVTLVLQRIGAPLVGYILVGLLIGPTGTGLLEASPQLELLAEIGIVFLMFNVGLEFSLPVLLASRRAVLGLGGLQVLCTSVIVAGLALAAGVSFLAAVLLGGAVAMSSTAITIRQLTDQGELDTRHGRASVGTLLFQDLATLPFLVLVAALGVVGSSHDAGADIATYGLSTRAIDDRYRCGGLERAGCKAWHRGARVRRSTRYWPTPTVENCVAGPSHRFARTLHACHAHHCHRSCLGGA